jgi:hypothetical protein
MRTGRRSPRSRDLDATLAAVRSDTAEALNELDGLHLGVKPNEPLWHAIEGMKTIAWCVDALARLNPAPRRQPRPIRRKASR